MRASKVVVGALHTVVVVASSEMLVGTSFEASNSTAEVEDWMITSYPLRMHSWPARSHDRSSARPTGGRWPGSLLRAGSWPRWCRARDVGLPGQAHRGRACGNGGTLQRSRGSALILARRSCRIQ